MAKSKKGKGQGGHHSKGGGRDNRKSRRELPEFVLVGEEFAHNARVTPGYLPLHWQAGGAIQLLSPGLYLRYRGGLASVTKSMKVKDAVLYALWEDPDAEYRVGRDRWVQPGANAGFLVPNPFDEGPPWLPLQAKIEIDGPELDQGLLSSWVDQIHCVPFKGELSQENDGLTISTDGAIERDFERADQALLDTLRWLKDNPDDDSTAAVTARLMLIEQGHGLQRAGISITHHDDDASKELLDELLPAFAPDVAPVVKAIWNVWNSEDVPTKEAVKTLAKELKPHLAESSPLQNPENLAILITWISGIFGARPDRDLNRPSRSLFAVVRYLRSLNNRIELFDHEDAKPPVFPLSQSETKDLLLDLSRFPDRETDFERLVRAMAVGESTHDFGRPNLDHIRPFKIGLPRVNDYPIATRTLLSRYDGIITAWSFRGLELTRNNIDASHLAANLIFDTTSTAGVRGIARVLGSKKPIVEPLNEALQIKPRFGPGVHPHYAALVDLTKKELPEIVEQAEKASRAGKAYENRLLDGLSAHEFLVSRNDNANEDGGYRPVAPEWGESVTSPVRRQFMFWRAFCRSIQWNAPDVYGDFFDEMIPRLTELPSRLENEALALLRNWLRRDSSHVERAEAWADALAERLAGLVDDYKANEDHWDERFSSLFAALAILDRGTFKEQLEALANSDRWDFEDLGRILEGVRHAGWQDELVDEPVFRILHTKLIDADGPHADLGRVEWTRKALERGDQAKAIRWFVHRDNYPRVTFSPEFREWFRSDGLRAIEKPNDSVIEILQVALRTIDEGQLDILVHHLTKATTWPDDEVLKELVEARRFRGASHWLQGHGQADPQRLESVIEGLFEHAKNAEDLREIALLVRFAGEHDIADVSEHRARLMDAIGSRSLSPDLPHSAPVALDAWRLAGLSPLNKRGLELAESAAKWFIPSGNRQFTSYVAYTFEHLLLDQYGEQLTAAFDDRAKSAELANAIDGHKWSDTARPIIEAFEQLSARSSKGKTAFSAMVSATWARVIRGAVHQSVLDLLDGNPIEDTKAILTQFAENFAVDSGSSDAVDADDTNGQTDDGTDESAESGAGEDADASDFASRVANAAADGMLRAIEETVAFWQEALADVESAPDASILKRLPSYCRSAHDVRRALFTKVRDVAREHDLSLKDPRRLLRTDFLDTSTELDAYDFDALLRLLVELQKKHEAPAELTLNRRSIEFPMQAEDASVGDADEEDAAENPTAKEGAAGDESDSEPIAETAEETVEAELSEEADDDESPEDEEEQSDDEGQDDSKNNEDAPHVLKQAWKKDAATEVRAEAFGHPMLPALIRELLDRNEALRLSLQGKGEKLRFILSWKDYR